MNVIDDRETNNINLCNVKPGGAFMWREFICIRMDIPSELFKAVASAIGADEIPIMIITSGQVVVIDRLTFVEPIKLEAHIVG